MAVTRTVQSKLATKTKPKAEEEVVKTADKKQETEAYDDAKGFLIAKKTKKVCYFCGNKVEPKYWESTMLRKYINDRGRIVARGRCGNCAKHQRRVSRAIKHARHLALLPFTVRI